MSRLVGICRRRECDTALACSIREHCHPGYVRVMKLTIQTASQMCVCECECMCVSVSV